MSELDNPAWAALTTRQAHLAQGQGLARRYPVDVAQIGAVGASSREAADAIVPLIPAGEWLSFPATLEGLGALIPAGLHVTLDSQLMQMVSTRRVEIPEVGIEPVTLSDADAQDMLTLADLTRPGPFRSRTHAFGTYLGIRDAGRLVAMAGERMHLPGHREISAVCTHPDYQGRGYARFLVTRLMDAIYDQGLTPFLHVHFSNLRAQAVYESLGFVVRRRLPLIVVERV